MMLTQAYHSGRIIALTSILLVMINPVYAIPSYVIDKLFTPTQQAKIKARWTGKSIIGDIDFNLGIYDEKTRISNNASVFINSPDKTYWRWTKVELDKNNQVPSNGKIHRNNLGIFQLRDAAFVAWVTDNVSLKTLIKDELVAQAQINITNLSTNYWVQNKYGDGDAIFDTGNWFATLAMAYVYVESAFSVKEKIIFANNYLEKSATFLANEVNTSLNNCLQGRNPNTNTSPPYPVINIAGTFNTYTYKTAQGIATNPNNTLMRRLNNRKAYMLMTCLMSYLITDNQLHRNSCEMFVKECLVYGWFPDESFAELERSRPKRTALTGHGYSTITMGFCSLTAWIFWKKDQDSTLFEYQTALGNSRTEGGTKSLLWACKTYPKYFNGTFDRYKWQEPISSETKLDGRISSNERILTDAFWLAIPLSNYYPKDSELENQIKRNGEGYQNVMHTTRYVDVWGSDVKGTFPGKHLSLINIFASALMEIYKIE